ncbi:protein-L-isoaspartate O-methyltransferase [Mesorhizobium mediterraneum]|uniref:Protein-L-isoaspartate O-methyltransferase n=2 Tax=Mesorhizobium mediterraneum TaxID=43617 RepID=A0AB36R0G6_9HYPH|nr:MULTISPECIES: protein-L-isoaspartate O-methyltransferase [Mesorhizobium]PAP98182.1 SAM-dependent methyltransferase [Mesorhizobium mediterraneum]RWN43718.1 MAG: protein-L-isoaspartate O-methyltransferase [Mesorhizobium sp.]RWP03520.1 MAG: protein-L-isoaspartate O-methyltransferase [Mesorhizobium sp.]WIW56071.1 protein-L-isoaspartate O-methyltransferase [Mesorhizobium mediterraneum]
MTPIAEARKFYARLMAANAGSADPRLEGVFAAVAREVFLGPGPWMVVAGNGKVETPTADPVHIYQNVLVALDADKGINNGEPFLHAMWIGKVAPKPGETVTHVGAGTGYYTALLARLVSPGGAVTAFELESSLADRARKNLEAYDEVAVIHGDAVISSLPPSDIIYVNAGVAAPPAEWLKALKPGGRMVFPWRPAERVGLAVMVTRTDKGLACDPFMRSWFIPCIGASLASSAARIDRESAARSRSIWLTSEAAPDRTATAIIGDVWFSSRSIGPS